MDIKDITAIIVDASIKIDSIVGPGCFERVYEEVLYYGLIKRGLRVQRQITMPITYESLNINDAYKIDLLLEDRVIIELKSVEHVLPVHFKQLTTYLKLMNLKNGILLNFNVDLMREGIHRIFNNSGK